MQSDSDAPQNIEIERKFILRNMPQFMAVQASKEIVQWYLPSFRIRQIGDEFKLTIKRGKWVVRQEFEINITKEEYEHFWILWNKKSLRKTRYYMEVEWLTFEADEYHGNLDWLYTIEVEFSSAEEAESFVPPAWFGEEVTEDDDFSNGSLSSQWLTESVIDKMKKENERPYLEAIRLNLSDWIGWIIKWALNLIGKTEKDRPIFIWISWGSNSWKTSKVTDEVIRKLEAEWVTVTKISMDDFCFWPTYLKKILKEWDVLNFDAPYSYDMELWKTKLNELMAGKDVKINTYDFKNDPKIDAQDIPKTQVYILEWLYILYDDDLKSRCDLRAFVDVSSHWRVMRRLTRDAWGSSWEVWRTWQSHLNVLEQILSTVEPMDKQYIN